jgi:hypothetical protein
MRIEPKMLAPPAIDTPDDSVDIILADCLESSSFNTFTINDQSENHFL